MILPVVVPTRLHQQVAQVAIHHNQLRSRRLHLHLSVQQRLRGPMSHLSPPGLQPIIMVEMVETAVTMTGLRVRGWPAHPALATRLRRTPSVRISFAWDSELTSPNLLPIASGTFSAGEPGIVANPLPTGTSSSGSEAGNGTLTGPPAGEPSAVGASAKSGISKGAITLITIVSLLLFLLLLVLFVRRRWVSRRRDRMKQWWYTRKRNSKNYGDEKTMAPYTEEKPLPPPAEPTWTPGFYNESGTPVQFASIIPSPPPSAAVRPQGSTTHPNTDRFSIGSDSSSGHTMNSDFNVVVRDPESGAQRESFKFPKPPFQAATEAASVHSRNSTSATSHAAVCSTGRWVPGAGVKQGSLSSLSRPPITAPEPVMTKRGSAEGQAIPNPFASQSDPSIHSPNPFDDPNVDPYGGISSHFVTETVYRPFTPSLADELLVKKGDQVQILEVFEDGWAMVMKAEPDFSASPSAQQGFIPLACLRESQQDLTAFLNTKRVQSFSVASQTSG